MPGEIKHSWHGTVLTITSDSGTSSADLRGPVGNDGVRGPQGRPGVITNPDGTIDYTGYATEQYVEERLEDLEFEPTVDLSNYYTKDEIDATLAEFQPSGGGGGGSGNNAVLTVQNTAGWLYKTISEGAACSVQGAWSSTEGGIPTGNGAITVTVNGVIKYSANVPQGPFSINIAPFLTSGTNSVRVSVTDVYANVRSIIYSVEVVALSVTSTFDATVSYEGAIDFPYTATGAVTKTVYFYMDGTKIGTQTVTTSGRQKTFTIPAQKHGAHKFEVYFTAEINGSTVESNRLVYDLICTEVGNETPIIACAFSQLTATQFEVVKIYYSVFTPNALTSQVELLANDTRVNELTVDRTQQLWSYRAETEGTLKLEIKSGSAVKTITITVEPADMDAEATTENLELYLSSYGRNNSEGNPASWVYGDIACEFENYNWKSDGWVADDDGLTVHRITGDARLTIPLYMFQNDARDTGKTIEIEFATRNTLDYDAVIASCMANGIGFQMTAQKAIIKSEQSAITTPYKEDEHIRLSFVIEKRAENRLIYTYLNGIMCGAVQYADNDNFSQPFPVGITLGSNMATLDIYTIRVYSNNLTRYQILDNWIADTQDVDERFARYSRNNVYDAYGNIVINRLPNTLPYLILSAPALPESKGSPVTVKAQYVDPVNPAKSFTHNEAEADVQGTSSAGYVRKNYIIEYPDTYKLREDSIPTNIFTYKADVASSEGANNVELVKLYNTISPYKTPPQLENASVRQGIDGFPIVIFHNDGDETTFIGKYNFNNDKATPEVFGFAPGDESWEIRNNTSNRVLFKNADFEGTDWLNDFEARYPKDNVNAQKLAAFAEWVVSTDTTGLSETERAARLEKFKTELPAHAEVQSALFYYLFTELFLMVDSRAKNAFPTFYGSDKVCWLPYDMDTALGINNEGALSFGYELEDTDHTASGADVFNGQKSVFWNNLRDTYGEEIKEMYQKLRTDKVLTYEGVEQMFADHQKIWPEAIWNEDAWYKYLQPLVDNNNGSYLAMLQGNKAEQRKWWLYNRFRYMDSKYITGDAKTDFITLRGYEKSDITLEPYADIYANIQYGSYWVQERALRGQSYTLECPMDTLNDTEIYIYSASQLKNIGDLSGLKVGYADFTSATKLQSLKLGSAASDYSNSNLTELYLGNNTLLHTLDVRNCPMLGSGEKQQSVDLRGCTNIEHIYFDGTTIKGCALPNGGILKTLHLPGTITNLTILNQKSLTDLTIPNYSNLSTIRLENVNKNVDMETILRGINPGSRVRLIGIDWSFDTAAEVEALFDVLDTMKGLDENDKNMDKVQISGIIRVPALLSEELEHLQSRYPTLTYVCDSIAYKVTYLNYDGTELYCYGAAAGTKAIDPVATGLISTPKKPSIPGTTYRYKGWNKLPIITEPTTITAVYEAVAAQYLVRFVDTDGTLLYETRATYGSTAQYGAARPTAPSGKIFAGWYPSPRNITGATTITALYASNDTTYEVIEDSWDDILVAISNGTYAEKYHRNMVKMITTTNNKKCYFRIVGFASDIMVDGSYAPISFVTDSNWDDGTANQWHTDDTSEGALRWSMSSLRAYVQSCTDLLPENIRNRVVAVRKRSNIYTSAYASNQAWETTYDYMWIPSVSEYSATGQGKTYLEDGTLISSDYYLKTSQVGGTYVRYWTRDKYGSNVSSGTTQDSDSWQYVAILRTDTALYDSPLGSLPSKTTDRYEQVGFCLA